MSRNLSPSHAIRRNSREHRTHCPPSVSYSHHQHSGVTYEFKTDDARHPLSPREKAVQEQQRQHSRHYGFIAQELAAIMPEVVSEDKLGFKVVAYSRLVPVLSTALSSVLDRLEVLEIEVEACTATTTPGITSASPFSPASTRSRVKRSSDNVGERRGELTAGAEDETQFSTGHFSAGQLSAGEFKTGDFGRKSDTNTRTSQDGSMGSTSGDTGRGGRTAVRNGKAEKDTEELLGVVTLPFLLPAGESEREIEREIDGEGRSVVRGRIDQDIHSTGAWEPRDVSPTAVAPSIFSSSSSTMGLGDSTAKMESKAKPGVRPATAGRKSRRHLMSLEKENEILRGKVDGLETRLAALESKIGVAL